MSQPAPRNAAVARWAATRARGFRRFLLVRGLLGYGGIMFAILALLVTHRFGVSHPRLPLLLGLALPMALVGGLAWAAFTWWTNDRIFNTLAKNRQP